MEEEKQDLLLDVVHPFTKELINVFIKHHEKAQKLNNEEDRLIALKAINDITDFIVKKYKEDTLSLLPVVYDGSGMPYVDTELVSFLLKVYSRIAFHEIKKGE